MVDVGSEPFARLLKALLKMQVVPFLGAGFSYGARHPESGWKTTPSRMPTQLWQWLTAKLLDEVQPSFETATLRKVLNTPVGPIGEDARTSVQAPPSPSLAHLAEIATTLFGSSEVCETLHIAQYAELRPEPQHRYLAYLAREGLIDEVITTNYDCCLETAFRESFFPPPHHSRLGTVRNLEEYRKKGSAYRGGGRLLLYKVNGCAEAYGASKRTSEICPTAENQRAWRAQAKRIILTERQLQSFRDQFWAQDLIRDRFRSRHLFFSGFGNDEPQIRHTMLTLIGEFANGSVNDERPPTKAMDSPNAPFVHSYEGDLSFNQLQMLVAFMDAHSVPRFTSEPLSDRIRPLYRNVLTAAPPEDTAGTTTLDALKAQEGSSPKLSSETLMRALFQEAFIHLVRRALRDEEPFAVWLRASTPNWRTWTTYLLRIIPEENHRPFKHLCYRVLSPDDDRSFPLMLHRYLWCVRYPEPSCDGNFQCPEGWYMPLREDPLFFLLTIMWICLLSKRDRLPRPSRYGLRIHLRTGGHVHVVAQDALSELQAGDEGADRKSRLHWLIVVPTLRKDVDARGRWRSVRGNRLRVGLWVAVESAALIQNAERPQRVLDCLHSTFAAVTPRRSAARLRPSVTRRA